VSLDVRTMGYDFLFSDPCIAKADNVVNSWSPIILFEPKDPDFIGLVGVQPLMLKLVKADGNEISPTSFLRFEYLLTSRGLPVIDSNEHPYIKWYGLTIPQMQDSKRHRSMIISLARFLGPALSVPSIDYDISSWMSGLENQALADPEHPGYLGFSEVNCLWIAPGSSLRLSLKSPDLWSKAHANNFLYLRGAVRQRAAY